MIRIKNPATAGLCFYLAAILALALGLSLLPHPDRTAVAQQPPASAPDKDIRKLIAEWEALKKQREELERQEAAKAAEVLAEWERLAKALEESGIRVPLPPRPTPQPKPPVDPKPITVGAFRVLFVRESGDDSLTREQLIVWHSADIRAYLDRKCAKGPDGTPDRRFWDKDVVLAKESPVLAKLWEATKPALASAKLPVIVIVADSKGEVFEMPKTVAETLQLLKKHGGE